MWTLTADEPWTLGIGPLFEHEPDEPGGGGAGAATAESDEEPGAAGEEGGERGEDDADRPETFEERLERIAKSEDLSEFRDDEDTGGLDLQDVEAEDEEPEAGEGGAAAEDEDEATADAADFELPDGWKRTETGKIQRPDGSWASKAEIEAIKAGEPVETVTTTGEEEDGPLVVSVPGRMPDDEDVELPLDADALEEMGLTPDEARERVQQLRNGYMRREEVNRHLEQIQDDRAELDFIEKQLREQPEDFILGHVSPEVRGRVVERVLATMPEETFNTLVQKVAGWNRDPVSRREEALRIREERTERREKIRDEYQETTESRRRAAEIGREVSRLIPEAWPEDKAERFFRFSVAALRDHIVQNEIEDLDPADVPKVLGQVGVLDDYGLSENGGPGTGSEADRSASAAGSDDGPAGEAEIEKAKRAGEEVRERTKRRKEAAATAPAGAGSSVIAGAKWPKDQTFEERMNLLEKRLGVK